MKLFILEDNKNVAETLRRFLTDAGHQVAMAFSWEEAKPLLLKNYDVYIVDFVLPDTQGGQAMKMIAQQKTDKDISFVLISGIFNEQHILGKIPEELKKRTVFMKKPIDTQELMEKIGKLNSKNKESAQTFHSRRLSASLKTGFFNKTIDSRFLVDILLSFNAQKFSGDLIIKSNGEGSSVVEFYNGGIIKVVSINAPSYFGNLLVEHGFSLQKEIEEVLALKEKKYIGQILIEKGLLSPHMVNFILKEQAKVRLSMLIADCRSFTLKILNNKTEMSDNAVTEFNRAEILDWAVECVKTKFHDTWLEDFYLENKNLFPQPVSAIESIVQKNRDFLIRYNNLFKDITGKTSLADLLKQTRMEKRTFLELVYWGIAANSIKLIERREDRQSLEKVQDFVDKILTQKARTFFDVLHVPWKASITEVNKNYKDIIKIIHPDNLPSHCGVKLREKCEKALKKINIAYDVLSDVQKRRQYCEEKEMHNFSNTVSSYEKALKLLKTGQYEESLKIFHSIKEAPFCPSEIFLYMLWAEMQVHPEQLEDKVIAGKFRERISKSPIELRISPLFWFVSGLFYSKVHHQYEKAGMLFKKALKINPGFVEASRELLKANTKLKESLIKEKKPFLSKFFPFKKSS